MYVYPVCRLNDTSYGLVTTEQCNYVKDMTCQREWLTAKNLYPDLIPDYEILNDMQ